MNKRLSLPFLILLFIFGCKEEDSSPSQCGRVELAINGVSNKASKPMAIISEMKSQLNIRLFTVVNTEDTLHFSMAVHNWTLAHSTPDKAMVNTFTSEFTYDSCQTTTESFENCASFIGYAIYKNKDSFYYTLDQESDKLNQIRILSIDESKKKLSGDFNFRVVKIDDSGLGDTVTVAGSFTDVCYLINKID
ncbi:hypothetical protein [Pontibacter mangrovi]|uniref:Lipoprotein n=1 Tax=Pontibacter mangrovi TaxID=2589816 RepID=A0A501W435_9BACT|nr:hypothetical protein [Pontibacter mangrovi]TPE44349.1 hypothetical protein FJM65_09365 [Pontibacter mangrovi]